MVAEIVTDCQLLFCLLSSSFEWARRIRTVLAEVERIEGFGQGVTGLLWLWNCVEKREETVGPPESTEPAT
jgi:hypothetical protein